MSCLLDLLGSKSSRAKLMGLLTTEFDFSEMESEEDLGQVYTTKLSQSKLHQCTATTVTEFVLHIHITILVLEVHVLTRSACMNLIASVGHCGIVSERQPQSM